MSAEAGEVSAPPSTEARAPRAIAFGRLAASPWGRAALVVVATRVIFLTIAYAASYFLSTETHGAPQAGFLDIWARWDALRFFTIAEHGYDSPQSTPNATAFFPLFPLLIRALMLLGLGPLGAGMVLSALGSWVALAYLYRLAESKQPGTGRDSMLYLALWPTAVFLVAPYSESIFLAGAIAAFYHAAGERWHLVGLPAAVAMGSRFAGVFLVAGLAVKFLAQGRFSAQRVGNAALSLVVGLLPLLAYGAFLAQVKGDALHFFLDQRLGWGRSFTGPASAFRNSVDNLDLLTSGNMMAAYRLEIVGAAVGIALVAWALVRREWGYATFMGLSLGALLVSTEYMSIPRILLTFFPAALWMATATRSRPQLHELYVAAGAVMMTIGVIVYTRGEWFF